MFARVLRGHRPPLPSLRAPLHLPRPLPRRNPTPPALPHLLPHLRHAHTRPSSPPSADGPHVLAREGSVGKHPFDPEGHPPPGGGGGSGGGGGGGGVKRERERERDKMRDGPADPIAGPSGRARPDPASPAESEPAQKLEEGEKGEEEDAPDAPAPPADAPTLPPPTTLRARPLPSHPFDTYAFVSRLAGNEVSPAAARTLMEAVRGMIHHRTGIAQTRMLSREEMDNDAYRFKAALSAVRTGHSVRSRRDGVTLRAAASAIRREVDGLEQKIKEDIALMRHDIEIETNNRKDETRGDMKRFDIAREEINNKFTISLGDLRTEIEGAKWDATRRAIAIILTLVIIGVVLASMGAKPKPVPVPAKPKPVMVDVGVGSEYDDELRDTEEELDRLLGEVERKRRREAEERHEVEGRI